jgi:hypothetical protein
LAATTLYVLGTSGSGASTVNITVTFTDATSQTLTGATMSDWYNGTPFTVQGLGRINRNTNVLEASTTNPRLYQIPVTIDLGNQSKLIQSITVTRTSAAGALNIFGASVLQTGTCPVISAASAASTTFTSSTFSWTLGSYGTSGTSATYTLEVYTDAAYTTPVAGSPFTNLSTTSQVVPTIVGTPYYYKVKANNGTCDSPYVTGTFTPNYCVPTSTSTSYYISNFTTTGGFTNFSNTTAASSYTNYSATQIVTKAPGSTFYFNGIRSSTFAKLNVYVDWNNDLDFDDANETVATIPNGSATTFNGSVNIPAGTALGNYRMRVRSTYYSGYTLAPCGAIYYGEAEDYTIAVVTPPANCTAPAAPTVAISSPTSSSLSVTVTPPATAPTGGYLIIKSTAATLTDTPVLGTEYAAGTAFGGGTVVSFGTATTTPADFMVSNTAYNYFVYSYNNEGITCFGPVYSATAATVSGSSCIAPSLASGASNISATGAILNYTSSLAGGALAPTYTIQLSTASDFASLVGTYTTTNTSYPVTGLVAGTTYYFRVKATTTGCFTDTWSTSVSFVAENSFTPIQLVNSGFNADVIANGNGIASTSTTAPVDAANYSYLSQDYKPNAATTPTTSAAPSNKRLTGTVPGLVFLLQDYSGNNALRLPAQGVPGLLQFTEQIKASNLYFAITSGDGNSVYSAEIKFSDNTSQLVENLAATNWDGAAPAATPQIGVSMARVSRNDGVGAIAGSGFKFFQATIGIEPANQSKFITGVQFTKTSTGATSPIPNIFAISAKQVSACPMLSSTSVTTITTTGATINWALDVLSPAALSYNLEVFTDAAYTTPITGSPFNNLTTSSQVLSGLSPAVTYYYRVQANNATCSSAFSTGSFTTSCTAPAAPTAVAQTFCASELPTVADLEATADTGATIKWYYTATSTAPLGDVVPLATGTYYATQTLAQCESTTRTPVTVTITTTPLVTVDTTQEFCATTSPTVASLAATPATGGTVKWYDVATAGTELPATTALTSGSYYVSQVVGTCESNRVAVTVTIGPAPTAPAADAAQGVCTGATVANLTATAGTGNTLHWYDVATGGTALAATATLATGTYYVSQSFATCESDRTEVAVTVNFVDAPDAAATQTFCSSATPTVASLAATADTDGTIKWYTAATGGTALSAAAALVTGNYYASQVIGSCESTRTAVAVTVINLSAPVAPATQAYCHGVTIAGLNGTASAGATLNWYTDLDSEPLATTTVIESGTYYVTQFIGECESASTTVTVNITTVPQPTIDNVQFCTGATVAELATATTGTTLEWTFNGDVVAATDALVTGTYTATQTLGTCESTPLEVAVTVTTTPQPDAPTTQSACIDGNVASLNQGTPVTGATFNWYLDGELQSPEAPLFATGVYTATLTIAGCESAPITVAVTLSTTPVPTAPATQSFCAGATVIELQASIETGATVNWYYDGDLLTGDEELIAGVYTVTQTVNGCEGQSAIVTVTINATPQAPAASAIQLFTNGDTVADLDVELLDGATANWFVMNDDGELVSIPATTVLEDGITYYVSQTLGTCTGEVSPIIANDVAKISEFELNGLSVYPNPVKDMLTIAYKDTLTEVYLVNMLGQTVAKQTANSNEARINVSALAGGNYILIVQAADGKFGTFKVIKH